MNLGGALDVAIGLALTYFLASLVASAVKEMFASVLQWRGQFLKKGLQVLLSTETGSSFSYGPLGWVLSLVKSLRRRSGQAPNLTAAEAMATAKVQGVLSHTLIKGTPTKRPSYIPARDFSTALFDKLSDASSGSVVAAQLVAQVEKMVDALPTSDVKTQLTGFFLQAGNNPDLIAQVDQVRTTLAALPNSDFKTSLTTFIQREGGNLAALGQRMGLLPDGDVKTALSVLIDFIGRPGADPAGLRERVASLVDGDVKTALTAFINQSGDIFAQVKSTVAALPDCDIKSALNAFIQQTDGDLERLRARIELWFDDAMDRLSGIYKRFAQYVLFGLGLAIAVGLNVDTVHLAVALWTQPPLRAAMVAQAEATIAKEATNAKDATNTNEATKPPPVTKAANDLEGLPVPIGRAADTTLFGTPWKDDPHWWGGWNWWTIVGWLISAIAISLGAPFWFDILNGAVSMRGAGPQPPRSDQPPATS